MSQQEDSKASGAPASFKTFRDPALSLWQGVVHAKLLHHAAAGKTELPAEHRGLGKTAEHPYMAATSRVIHDMQHAVAPAPATMHGPPKPKDLATCAELAAKLAWATVFDREKAVALRDEFGNSVCDPFWMECFAEYERLVATGGTQPYLDYTDIGQFVVEDCFPEKATVAIISDWGTGMNDAMVLLQQIADNFTPDVLIHLGDIYYAGLRSENEAHFTKLIDEVWPEKRPLVYTLDGNHDRYAGSHGGYYPMIVTLNADKKFMQPNSYFCLRNDYWQFVAMDTGYHDTNPWTEYKNLTWLEEREAEWCRDKIRGGGRRGTVVRSHHLLMSGIGVGRDESGKLLAVNPKLAEAFAPVFDKIDFWLWGHEHDLCIFEPYTMNGGVELPTCRCVGASAVPVFVPEPEGQVGVSPGLTPPDMEEEAPQLVPKTGLGNNGEVMNHSYAILSLDGAAMAIEYYQVESVGASRKVPPALMKIAFRDEVKGPKGMGKVGAKGWLAGLFG